MILICESIPDLRTAVKELTSQSNWQYSSTLTIEKKKCVGLEAGRMGDRRGGDKKFFGLAPFSY